MGQAILLKVINFSAAPGSQFALPSGTCGGWFRNFNNTTNASTPYFLHGLSNASNQQGFAMLQATSGANNNALQVFAWNSAGSQEVGLLGSTNLADGNWHHLCYVFDTANGGANAIYVDGVNQGGANSSAAWNIITGAGPLWDGSGPASSWSSFQGNQGQAVAEWFWSTAKLTALEVAALAKGQRGWTVRNLLGYWPLQDGGDPNFDLSGNKWTLSTSGGNSVTFGPPLTMFTPRIPAQFIPGAVTVAKGFPPFQIKSIAA